MRRLLISIAIPLLLGSALAATFEIDADLMRGIDDTVKSLDSNVSLRDAKAVAEAGELAGLFQQIEAYYARKGNTADAAGFARESYDLASRAQQAAAAGDFDGAGDAVGKLIKSCKTCHTVYRKE